MLGYAKWLLLATAICLMALQQSAGQIENYVPHQQQPSLNGERQGKDLLDWIGLGTGPDKDPYLARTNANCLNGDLAECFKSRALGSLDEFFSQPEYDLTSNARIVRMPVEHLRSVAQEPYEFTSEARADEPEWDQLVKFAMRKVEKFLKSTAIEVQFPEDVTERGRYSPRFVDEIADEIDIIEDKRDTLFSRKRLRKLIIPFLIVLKLFKLKLLLFLPLILGLASFKKLLGFLAIVVPGLIGFFKLCKPDLGQHNYHVPQYSSAGVGLLGGSGGGFHQPHHYYNREQSSFPSPTVLHQDLSYGHGYYERQHAHKGPGVAFRDDAQDIAYNGYSEYRSAKNIPAAADINAQVKPAKKSILPDS